MVRHDIPLDDAIAVVAAVGTSDDETEAVLMAAFTASIADGRMHLLDGRQPWKHLPTCSGSRQDRPSSTFKFRCRPHQEQHRQPLSTQRRGGVRKDNTGKMRRTTACRRNSKAPSSGSSRKAALVTSKEPYHWPCRHFNAAVPLNRGISVTSGLATTDNCHDLPEGWMRAECRGRPYYYRVDDPHGSTTWVHPVALRSASAGGRP